MRLASSSTFWMRSECCETSRTSCLRVRVRSRSCWIACGGTKLERIRPCASRSAIHIASLTSVLRPGTLRMCAALASTSSNSASSTCHTGFQYTPVASIATWRAVVLGQPVGQREQLGGGGAEAAHLLMHGRRDAAHAGHDGVLVHVQARTARVEHLHENLLAVAGRRRQSSSSKSTSRASGRRRPLPHCGVLAGLRVQLLNGLVAPRRGRPRQQRPISSYDRQPSPHNLAPSFMPRGRARPMANY